MPVFSSATKIQYIEVCLIQLVLEDILALSATDQVSHLFLT